MNSPQPSRTRSPSQSLSGRIFTLLVLVFVGLLGFVGLLILQSAWFGWLPYNLADFAGAHFASADDLVHELGFSLIFGTAAAGMFSQLQNPAAHIAGQLMAVLAWLAWLVAAAITNNWVPFIPLIAVFGGVTFLAAAFHPARRGLLSWFSRSRIDRTMLALVAAAAIPLLVFAVSNIGLQSGGGAGFPGFAGHRPPAFHGGGAAADPDTTEEQSAPENDSGGSAGQDDHAVIGHYKNMAAFSFLVIGLGLLASLRPAGWKLAAWTAGLLPVVLGGASLILPGNSASLSPFWSLAGIAWGGGFIAVAVLRKEG